MPENDTERGKVKIEGPSVAASASVSKYSWSDLLKVIAMPLVTLILGFIFNASLNSRQDSESRVRLYADMMGRREQADSELRKDMFKSILDTFMTKDRKPKTDERLRQEVLNLELLAFNFHESLDIGPLFKDVRNRIPDRQEGFYADLRSRLEKVAREVIERQLTGLTDVGMVERGDTLPANIKQLEAYLSFGAHTVPNPEVERGKGVSRLCLFIPWTSKTLHYRQFTLEITRYDPLSHEVQVRLYVSHVLTQTECQQADLDAVDNVEVDANFWVGLFDFPMIDNTRLTYGERCAISLTALTPSVLTVALTYFPGSRASLKDKPYYDEVIHDLVRR